MKLTKIEDCLNFGDLLYIEYTENEEIIGEDTTDKLQKDQGVVLVGGENKKEEILIYDFKKSLNIILDYFDQEDNEMEKCDFELNTSILKYLGEKKNKKYSNLLDFFKKNKNPDFCKFLFF